MAKVPKKPGVYTVAGRRIRRLANGRVRFLPGKPTPSRPKARKAATSRRKTNMPAKRSYRSRARGLMSGVDTTALVAGLAAGAAAPYATSLLGPYGAPAAFAVAGVVAKQPALQALAGVQLGSALIGGLPGTTDASAARGGPMYLGA